MKAIRVDERNLEKIKLEEVLREILERLRQFPI